MLEFRRPDPRSALTWLAAWVIALIGLALVPMGGIETELAGMANEIQYGYKTGGGELSNTKLVR